MLHGIDVSHHTVIRDWRGLSYVGPSSSSRKPAIEQALGTRSSANVGMAFPILGLLRTAFRELRGSHDQT
jgi:hypothetical protein